MKPLGCGLLIVCACLANHVARAASRIAVSSARGFPSRTVEVPVTFRGDSNAPPTVVAFQADIRFDPAAVLAGDALPGRSLKDHVLHSHQLSNGFMRLVLFSPNNQPLSNGIVARVPFTLRPEGGYGDQPLTLSYALMASAAPTAVPADRRSGTLIVNPVFVAADGTVQFFLGVEPEQTYVVQASTDFKNWVNVSTNFSSEAILELMNQDALQFPRRYYRAVAFQGAESVRLGAIHLQPGGKVVFDIEGGNSEPASLQASTNLMDWVTLEQHMLLRGTVRFTNSVDHLIPYRFFRVRSE